MSHFSIERKYINNITGLVSNNIKDVLSGDVVIDPKFVAKGKPETTTPFKDIDILDYRTVFSDYIKEINRVKAFDYDLYFDVLEESIRNLWDPGKFYLIFHSSGYDSRITSYFIDKLYSTAAPAGILFVSFPNEARLFKDIMFYKGWAEQDLFIYDLHKDPQTYNFKTAWQSLNGPSDYPVFRFYHCVNYLQSIDKIPKENLVMFVSSYQNELLEARGTVDQFFKEWYYTRNARLDASLPFYRRTPFLYPKLVDTIFSFKPNRAVNDLRYNLVKRLDSKLADLPRKGHNPNKVFPDIVFRKIVGDFENSTLFKYINTGDFNYSPNYTKSGRWWTYWSIASLVEQLLREGKKVIYGNNII